MKVTVPRIEIVYISHFLALNPSIKIDILINDEKPFLLF